jgi:hypothetical protein
LLIDARDVPYTCFFRLERSSDVAGFGDIALFSFPFFVSFESASTSTTSLFRFPAARVGGKFSFFLLLPVRAKKEVIGSSSREKSMTEP